MRIAEIKFTSWDKPVMVDPGDLSIKVGDQVLVNSEFGLDAGQVVSISDAKDDSPSEETLGSIERMVGHEDLKTMEEIKAQKGETIEYCKKMIKKHELEMKLIDCHTSFDGRRVTFAFIADGRVDFRELVKDLTRHFQKSIRLHQLGVRDEAKLTGDIGCCGRKICCQGHLKTLESITSELAEQQQVAHRGSERLSGICGRLKCCLAYEQNLYEELSAKLPAVGIRVRTDHGRGEVIGWHVLRSSVKVRLDPDKDSKEGDRPVVIDVIIGESKVKS